jgi:hypothetical protein
MRNLNKRRNPLNEATTLINLTAGYKKHITRISDISYAYQPGRKNGGCCVKYDIPRDGAQVACHTGRAWIQTEGPPANSDS